MRRDLAHLTADAWALYLHHAEAGRTAEAAEALCQYYRLRQAQEAPCAAA